MPPCIIGLAPSDEGKLLVGLGVGGVDGSCGGGSSDGDAVVGVKLIVPLSLLLTAAANLTS